MIDASLVVEVETRETDGGVGGVDEMKKSKDSNHRGFAFITFSNEASCKNAIAKDHGCIRWTCSGKQKNKTYRMYLKPKQNLQDGETMEKNSNICFLWSAGRCTHGDACKFAHEGDGACAAKPEKQLSHADRLKKRKCFNFKKKGKCKSGDACPFSHDFTPSVGANLGSTSSKPSIPATEKHCINWKTKGRCRKGDACPYRHDPAIREKVLLKKNDTCKIVDEKKEGKEKERQPLSVRVFGLNYDTTEADVRDFFNHCGPIVEVTFPVFEDSKRSKGFCGILFQSPKAVQSAVDMDGQELNGRWLSIQAGKMYLKQWEANIEKGRGLAEEIGEPAIIGEFGQKVKRRKKHGFN